jgi:hypothetical protein
MIHANLNPEESAAAVASTEAVLASARKLLADVEVGASEADAALSAAIERQSGYGARIASGQGVSAKEAMAAANEIVQAREHAALFVSAKEQAQAKVDAAEIEHRDAVFSHEIHVIRQKRRELAAKQRLMAQAGLDYAASIEATRDAGEALLTLQRDAVARRKSAHIGHYTGESDQSLTGTRYLVRSLPQWLLACVREVPSNYFDYFEEADRQDVEAAK